MTELWPLVPICAYAAVLWVVLGRIALHVTPRFVVELRWVVAISVGFIALVAVATAAGVLP